MLDMTENAVGAVRKVLEAEDGVTGLRIMVQSGGCSGMQYSMGLETAPAENDAVFEFGGVKIYVDETSQPLLDGVVVDFKDELSGSGFTFENPNASAQCGCGKSFSC